MPKTINGINYQEAVLTTFKGLKKGTKIVIVDNSNGHNYPVNTVFTLAKDGTSSAGMSDAVVENIGRGNTLSIKDIRLLSNVVSIHDLKDSLKAIKEQYESEKTSLEAKIAFCERLGTATVDESMIKAYNIIMEMSKSDDLLEKVNILTKEL